MSILKDLTVLDLTQNIAGPFCTQLLGDYGANVIKIERPGSGDDTRRWTRHVLNGVSTSYLAVNRNKKSVCVDINSKEGADVVRRLAAKADVFVHAVRLGSLEARGLGYEDLKVLNPRLIHCAISAYGESGPRAAEPGYDALLQAYCGIMSVTGHPDRPPARVGVSLLDFGTGIWAFVGIMAALYRRKQTGSGAHVSTSLMESGVNSMSLFLAHFMADGSVLGRTGDLTQFAAPYESFRTQDGAVYIVAFNDNLFQKTCEALGIPELAQDPRFIKMEDRAKPDVRAVLHVLLEERTSRLTSIECERLLREGGAACSAINTVDRVYEDEQVRAMKMIRPLPGAHYPGLQTVDLPVSIDGVRAQLQSAPPELGSHTEEVLQWAGFTTHDLERLRGQKVIA